MHPLLPQEIYVYCYLLFSHVILLIEISGVFNGCYYQDLFFAAGAVGTLAETSGAIAIDAAFVSV